MVRSKSTQLKIPSLLSAILVVLVFLIPSNLFYRLDQFNWAILGLRIDYLLGKIYLTDLCLGFFIIVGLISDGKAFLKIKHLWWFIGISLALLGRQIFTDFPVAAILQFSRILLVLTGVWLIKKNWPQLKLSWIWLALAVSNFFQTLLSIWQFFTQHSVGSYQWLLGEPNLSQSFGLAHGFFGNWGEKILPYGTTAHPNILAAWLVVSWWLLVVMSPKVSLPKYIKLYGLILSGFGAGWGIAVTQSITALGLWLHGLIYILISKFLKKITPQIAMIGFMVLLGCIALSPWISRAVVNTLPVSLQQLPSIYRRIYLQTAAEKIFLRNPIFGVGLNQFTAKLEATQPAPEPVRFDQPVHQVLWLWLAETGLLGIAWLLSLSLTTGIKTNIFKKLFWLGIVLFPSVVWDHYLLTQPTGLWIVAWWWIVLIR